MGAGINVGRGTVTTGFTKDGFQWNDKYNIFSGIIGGFFLALSYFGTDQSQVGRYLTAKNITESRMGLLMNGFVKVPMQFLILLLGAMLFSFYIFMESPVFFNTAVNKKVYESTYKDSLEETNISFKNISILQKQNAVKYVDAIKQNNAAAEKIYKDSLQILNAKSTAMRTQYKSFLKKADAAADTNDTNYIFLRFVVDNLPVGLVGLLIAIIFLAAWGSISAALNALASCTMIDFYLRFRKQHVHTDKQNKDEERKYKLSKWFTFFWGVFCIIVAEFATKMDSLIEAVNKYGSLFYGVILGIFLTAFYLKKIKSNAVFYAAVISELIIIYLFIQEESGAIGLGFLWLNVIGALLVVILSYIFQIIEYNTKTDKIIDR